MFKDKSSAGELKKNVSTESRSEWCAYLIGENHIKSVLINKYINKQFSREEYTCFMFYMNLM